MGQKIKRFQKIKIRIKKENKKKIKIKNKIKRNRKFLTHVLNFLVNSLLSIKKFKFFLLSSLEKVLRKMNFRRLIIFKFLILSSSSLFLLILSSSSFVILRIGMPMVRKGKETVRQ